jgi:hypothetical protein
MKHFVPVTSGVALLIASCGARTELLAPEVDDGSMSSDSSTLAEDAITDTHVGCVPGDITLTAAEPDVMFVLDRSGSMSMPFAGKQTRWQVLTSGLAATLPPVDTKMAIGALLFPSGSSMNDCEVPSQANLAPALDHVAALVSLMESNQPGGSTPTADAINVAAALLTSVRAASSARAIVLATDGAPNCNSSLDPATCTCAGGNTMCRHNANQCLDDTRTVQRISDVYAQGIPTYVIGIASGDNTFTEVLDAMAVAGGRPLTSGSTQYYPATTEADLDTALTAIRDQVSSCTYLTTSVPNTSGSIVLTLDGQTLPFNPDGGTMGWSWVNEGNGEIMLIGSTCDAVASDAGNTLVAHVVCGADQ